MPLAWPKLQICWYWRLLVHVFVSCSSFCRILANKIWYWFLWRKKTKTFYMKDIEIKGFRSCWVVNVVTKPSWLPFKTILMESIYFYMCIDLLICWLLYMTSSDNYLRLFSMKYEKLMTHTSISITLLCNIFFLTAFV